MKKVKLSRIVLETQYLIKILQKQFSTAVVFYKPHDLNLHMYVCLKKLVVLCDMATT